MEKKVTVTKLGANGSRDAALIAQHAARFNAEVFLVYGTKKVNAKSLMGLMTLGLKSGMEITLSATGRDEESAVAELYKVIG
ncbi:MAG: HPr family phosphocarrier protein [Clostridiales bacterium]|jgi:catabolite repression HPr-like protein|nr:HPr family phosphocarrier protein [Clostridiales bacterium]